MVVRSRLADLVRPDDGACEDCGATRGATWVRTWRMRLTRPWTFLVPEIERRCYDCWLDQQIGEGSR